MQRSAPPRALGSLLAVHVVATAGHVDHGKSTLVEALTGTDPDRLSEEKARGLTIDLGFADVTLPSGRGVAFVDVPGHVRFLKNMLAGVGAVDACLFVVAATEGWKPQSEEHLRILQLLGITHGTVALTNVDLVDDETRELARLELAERLEDTFLGWSEIVDVAAPAGTGVADLAAALDRMLADTPPAPDLGRPRLWIDRSFTISGAGTVVTGTLTGGSVSVDDDLVLLPQGRPVRIRGLQSLHRPEQVVGPGNRLAVNLGGIEHHEIRRGDALARPDRWHTTQVFDASLEVLATLGHDVSRRGAYAAYIGSGEHAVRLRVLGERPLSPASHGFVRLHLPTPLPLQPGDRFILRESGRSETVGGGEILDVDPVLPASEAQPDSSVERVVVERGWVEVDELERLTGRRAAPQVGRWVVAPEVEEKARAELIEAMERAGSLGLDVATLDERHRALLDTMAGVERQGGRVQRAGGADPLAHHPYLAALEADPFRPPPPEGVDRGELRELVRRGDVIEREGVCFARSAVDAAARRIAGLLESRPDGVTVSEIRQELGTTRKFVMPLLAQLDGTGLTRRRGDRRIAGPRLALPQHGGSGAVEDGAD